MDVLVTMLDGIPVVKIGSTLWVHGRAVPAPSPIAEEATPPPHPEILPQREMDRGWLTLRDPEYDSRAGLAALQQAREIGLRYLGTAEQDKEDRAILEDVERVHIPTGIIYGRLIAALKRRLDP